MEKVYSTGELFVLALQIIFIAIITYSISRIWSELIVTKTSKYIKTHFRVYFLITIIFTIISVLLLFSVFCLNNFMGKKKNKDKVENIYQFTVKDKQGIPHDVEIYPEEKSSNNFFKADLDLAKDLYLSLPKHLY
jgi:hypothetical protein